MDLLFLRQPQRHRLQMWHEKAEPARCFFLSDNNPSRAPLFDNPKLDYPRVVDLYNRKTLAQLAALLSQLRIGRVAATVAGCQWRAANHLCFRLSFGCSIYSGLLIVGCLIASLLNKGSGAEAPLMALRMLFGQDNVEYLFPD